MAGFLPKTAGLISDFDSFLDSIIKSAMTFQLLMRDFLRSNEAEIEHHLRDLNTLESDADNLRRDIRFRMYSRMLIPENRGDVLSILENADKIIDIIKKNAVKIDIERPLIPDYLKTGLTDLCDSAVQSVDYTIRAAKIYLRSPVEVQDLLTKVHFHEHHADQTEDDLKRRVFTSDEPKLSVKMQLSFLIEGISSIADTAEDVSDRISIAAIKREY